MIIEGHRSPNIKQTHVSDDTRGGIFEVLAKKESSQHYRPTIKSYTIQRLV